LKVETMLLILIKRTEVWIKTDHMRTCRSLPKCRKA